MSVVNRNKLKEYFLKGKTPTQDNFRDLIDSMMHREEEALLSDDYGIKVSARGSDKRLLSFFSNISDRSPNWFVEPYPKKSEEFGLNFLSQHQDKLVSHLFLGHNGNVGLGTLEPQNKLDVNGNIGMKGRRGYHYSGTVPGDGQWQNITPKLSRYQALEVMAQIGKKDKGMHAITHAIALSAFGQSRSAITKTRACFGSWRNKIDIRWRGTLYEYYLQVRTRRNYGEDHSIRYYITNLWWEDDEEAEISAEPAETE
jgi:hypothetical protein